jgi:hypothetical protein
MGATFFPLLYSVVLPNEDLQGFLSALEGRRAPTLESETVVQSAIAAGGTLRSAIKVAYSYSWVTRSYRDGSHPSEKIETSQAAYVAWFDKRRGPMLIALTCYKNGEGQKAYQISGVDPLVVIRGYAIPLGLFGIALFLARRRKSPSAP